MAVETLYSQDTTSFTLRFLVRPDHAVDGRVVLELADTFRERLVFPGCRLSSIWTKSPGMRAQPNIGDFSEGRWRAAVKKLGANDCAVLRLEAQTAAFPNQTIAFYSQLNPPGGDESLQAGTVDVTCTVPYFRHVAASADRVTALIELGRMIWDRVQPIYGFGSLAYTPKRVPFSPTAGAPRAGSTIPSADRAHAIPVAQTGSDIDGNIDVLIVEGRGIKGAFWANYLNAHHVAMTGGAAALGRALEGMRIDPLGEGALLIVATESPLPEDSGDNRRRYQRLEAALRPAFLSREETPERKRDLLGYFFRENK